MLFQISRLLTTVVIPAASVETTGSWEDENGNDRPDAGESIPLIVVVENTGTVTLEALRVSDSINSGGCTSAEPFRLERGQKHECTAVLQVSTGQQNSWM